MTAQQLPGFIISAHVFGILATLLWPSPGFATSIVGLIDRQHHRIVLAADSLVRHEDEQTKTKQCKIINTPNCVFSMAGQFTKDFPRFDLQELATDACSQSGDLRRKADAFVQLAKAPTIRLVQYLHDHESAHFASAVASGDFIDVLFAGIDKRHLSVFVRGFRIQRDGAVQVVADEISDTPKSHRGLLAGVTEAIAKYVSVHKNWEEMGTPLAAKTFVEMEIAANPDMVGAPISILEIDQSILRPGQFATRWIESGACKADAQNQDAKPN